MAVRLRGLFYARLVPVIGDLLRLSAVDAPIIACPITNPSGLCTTTSIRLISSSAFDFMAVRCTSTLCPGCPICAAQGIRHIFLSAARCAIF
ncbi:hypothetical protein COCOBI_19-1920 [Coccomyxa sp. Obi]|nr:hypothetical protein COCOBI_19-1920 [Coccomyxa sp. Obi]